MAATNQSSNHGPSAFKIFTDEDIYRAINDFKSRTSKMPTLIIKFDDLFEEAKIKDFDNFSEAVAVAPPAMRRTPQPVTSHFLSDSQLEILYGAALLPMTGDYGKVDAQISKDQVIKEVKIQKLIMMEGTLTDVLTWTATNCYITMLDPKFDGMKYYYVEFQVRGTVSVESKSTGNDDQAGGQNASSTDATAGSPGDGS